MLAQDEQWSLRTTLCFLFFKNFDRRFNKFPESLLCLGLLKIPSCYSLLEVLEYAPNLVIDNKT